jgi:acetylornithine deacetylase/succinyl-diaminopimelate desuccinylase-like protein
VRQRRPTLFAGHTDAVPTGASEAWSFDPFAATVRDGAQAAAVLST